MGGGSGSSSSSSEVVKVLLRKDSGLRLSVDGAEVTGAADDDDDVLLSVIRDIDRGSFGRGLPALPAAPPPPPPLSASPKRDPPEVPPKSWEVRKHHISGALRDTIV